MEGIMKKPNCILIPVDFSEPSLEAMEFGSLMADQMGASIVLLTVVEQFAQFDAYTVIHPDAKDAEQRLRTLFKERIANGSKEAAFPENKPKVLARYGAVIDEIIRAAAEFHADMIIMGT